MGWLMLVPVVLVLAMYVFVLALCRSSALGDEMMRRAIEHDRRDKFDRWPL